MKHVFLACLLLAGCASPPADPLAGVCSTYDGWEFPDGRIVPHGKIDFTHRPAPPICPDYREKERVADEAWTRELSESQNRIIAERVRRFRASHPGMPDQEKIAEWSQFMFGRPVECMTTRTLDYFETTCN